VYDARRLHQIIDGEKRSSGVNCDKGSNKSWPASPTTPDFKKNVKWENSNGNCGSGAAPGAFFYKKLQRTHSASNDYEKDMKQILDNYNLMLDNLIGIYDSNKEWIHVKMIDFAHTYRNDELLETQRELVDRNYLEALENLIKIFEEFLKECDV
jgi:1D-myo-inositol-tetrakisphosphate 5-kinase/inositol-polyphosphate multikinase